MFLTKLIKKSVTLEGVCYKGNFFTISPLVVLHVDNFSKFVLAQVTFDEIRQLDAFSKNLPTVKKVEVAHVLSTLEVVKLHGAVTCQNDCTSTAATATDAAVDAAAAADDDDDAAADAAVDAAATAVLTNTAMACCLM